MFDIDAGFLDYGVSNLGQEHINADNIADIDGFIYEMETGLEIDFPSFFEDDIKEVAEIAVDKGVEKSSHFLIFEAYLLKRVGKHVKLYKSDNYRDRDFLYAEGQLQRLRGSFFRYTIRGYKVDFESSDLKNISKNELYLM